MNPIASFVNRSVLLRVLLVLVGVGMGAGLVGFFARPDRDYTFEIAKNMDIFGKILREINLNYVDDIDPNQLVKVGVDAMLKKLDPYTNYITASEIEDFQLISTGQYGGVGAQLSTVEGTTFISEVYENWPAHKAGIMAGDVLLRIDNDDLKAKGYTSNQVRDLLRGQPKTTVRVVVQREGQPQPLTFEVMREDVKIDNVPFSGRVADGIGYISLSQFTKDASGDVRKAYDELKAKHGQLRGLILDLRGNPGGLLYEAVAVSNLFVPAGEKIVETRGKMDGSYKRYDSERPPMDAEIPLVVLVNGGSASASEIVSGVMQDLDRGVVVGQRSFGKGLVQTTRPLSYKTQLKITTARYYTPSGRCIQSIDYTHGENENAVKKADSLRQQFKTRNGRPVTDAGGILPDIEAKEPEIHKLTQDLLNKRLIFDFATRYRREHPELPASPSQFTIDDALYTQFVNYVRERNFESESKFNKDLEALNKTLEKEAYYSQVQTEVQAIKSRIEQLRKNDIYAHRDEISYFLRTEIVSRYHFKRGRIEASFTEDPYITTAVEVLNDPSRYRSILQGKK